MESKMSASKCEISFTHVDCYLKIFELALFGGVRPNT
jgi:hypothetical protein